MDQTQITKFALWLALTSPPLERAWIRTHSCGVAFFLGFGLRELGFGLGDLEGFGDLEGLGDLDGLGELELGLGLGDPVELGVGDEAPDEDADEDVAAEVDVLGFDDGLVLSDLRDVADVLADLNCDADELASMAAA